jgi:hypothetical protein
MISGVHRFALAFEAFGSTWLASYGLSKPSMAVQGLDLFAFLGSAILRQRRRHGAPSVD